MLNGRDTVEKWPATRRAWTRPLLIFGLGVAAGVLATQVLPVATESTPVQAQAPARDLKALAAEIDAIRGIMPDQAHSMADVGYHYANLWFAGESQNWELAAFYWGETRSHLRWSIRMKPTRPDASGKQVDMIAIAQAFEKAYGAGLNGCYDCHKAINKPYLRMTYPERSETELIDYAPK